MSKTDDFDAQITGLVNRDRQADYGHPIDHFTRSANIKVVLRDCPIPELRHALEMIADKMARLVHNPRHFDSWLDIAGYARTACMVMDKLDTRETPEEAKFGSARSTAPYTEVDE